jgi:4-aminobutyrate aminotransferase-like enzyme
LCLIALFVGGLPVRKCCAPAEIDGLATGGAECEAVDIKSKRDKLPERSERLGARIKELLGEALSLPFIRNLRCCGLMFAIDFAATTTQGGEAQYGKRSEWCG